MNRVIKQKGIIISILVAILFMQSFWLYDSFSRRKLQLLTSLESAATHSTYHYCADKFFAKDNPTKELKEQIEMELFLLKEPLEVKIKILDVPFYKCAKDNTEAFYYSLECKGNFHKKTLIVKPISVNAYIIKSIILWIGIGLVLILLIAVFTPIYFRNLRTQMQLQKLRDEFISNMTHELKTPISTISVASEIIQNNKIINDKDKILRYSKIIHEENNRLKRLVDMIMQVAIFESGTIKLDLTENNIHELIEAASTPLSLLIKKRKGELLLDLKAENAIGMVDKNHFSHIISNLIENAIKYNNGQPIIKVSTYNDNDRLIISVEDNGIGIQEKDLKYIFNKHYQASDKSKYKKSGIGLGLFYVYQVIKHHNASIRVESTFGMGTKFIIEI